MDATLLLTPTPSADTFTLVHSAGSVNVYQGATAIGTPISSVPTGTAGPLILASADGNTAVVHIDDSGGTPIPTAGLVVTSGAVTFDQNLGGFGSTVDVTVAAGATVNFATSQSLGSLDIESGSSANVLTGGQLLDANTLSLSGGLDLNGNSLTVNAPTAQDFTTLQPELATGRTVPEVAVTGGSPYIATAYAGLFALAGNGISVVAVPILAGLVGPSAPTPGPVTSNNVTADCSPRSLTVAIGPPATSATTSVSVADALSGGGVQGATVTHAAGTDVSVGNVINSIAAPGPTVTIGPPATTGPGGTVSVAVAPGTAPAGTYDVELTVTTAAGTVIDVWVNVIVK